MPCFFKTHIGSRDGQLVVNFLGLFLQNFDDNFFFLIWIKVGTIVFSYLDFTLFFTNKSHPLIHKFSLLEVFWFFQSFRMIRKSSSENTFRLNSFSSGIFW